MKTWISSIALVLALLPISLGAEMALVFRILGSFVHGTNNGCKQRVLSMINNFTSDPTGFVALQYSGKGLNDLGDFESCQQYPNMRYVVLEVNGQIISMALGICGPAECESKDYDILKTPVAQILTEMLKGLGEAKEEDLIFTDSLKVNQSRDLYSWGFYICIGICVLVISVSILSAVLAELRSYKGNGSSKPTRLERYIAPCNLVKNLAAIFAVTKTDEPDLKIFNGLRVVTMSWVVISHVFFYTTDGFITNFLKFYDMQFHFWNCLFINGTFSVDVFFFLSAFLCAYLMLKQMHQHNGRIPYLYTYVHRFMRLYPLYFAMTVFFCYIIPLYGDGPVFYRFSKLVDNDCKKYVYMNFLFINNFAPHDSNCMGWVWYLANDMQFFMITPILVKIYYHRKFLGVLTIAVIGIGCMTASFLLAIKFKLSVATVKYTTDFFKYYYDKPHNRIIPYLIGILAGYIYSEYRRGEKNWATRMTLFVKNNGLFRWFLYLFSLVALFMDVVAMYWMNNYPNSWSVLDDALYLVFAKVIFIVGLFWLMYPLMLGHGGLARQFLAHDFFVPFARCTFGAYLLHPTFMLFHHYNDSKGQIYDPQMNIFRFYGYFFLSYVLSFFATAIFESPVVVFDKTFIRGSLAKPHKSEDVAVPATAGIKDSVMDIGGSFRQDENAPLTAGHDSVLSASKE